MFFATQDSDEAIGARFFEQELVDEFFLVGLGFEMVIGSVGLLGEGFGMIDEALGLGLDEREKVLASDFEDVIDEAIEMLVAAEGEMAVKDDPVMAAEDGYNGGRESFAKAVHGVLLPTAVW
jgi:hypothetical protein